MILFFHNVNGVSSSRLRVQIVFLAHDGLVQLNDTRLSEANVDHTTWGVLTCRATQWYLFKPLVIAGLALMMDSNFGHKKPAHVIFQ